MLRFIASRLLSTAIVVMGVITLVFLLIHIVPGDPVEVMLGESAPTADREALRKALGLDQPILVQFQHYITKLAHGNLGESLHSKQPVSAILAERLPSTAILAVAGLGIALLIALPLGALAAMKQHTIWDSGAMTFALLGISIPHFWFGPLLILVFSLWLGWLPVSGQDHPLSLILPALTLGTALAAILSRMTRAVLLETLKEDYIRTARSKGLSETSIVLHHALKNAALPILTLLGLQLGALLGGAVITEIIFAWPGLGYTLVEAIQRRDYPVVQACVLLISLTYVFVNTATDLLYGYFDPRIRLQ
jgi:peptide/nickel transport system permease protein